MVLSDLSVTRPVFACVISLLLIAFGVIAFDRLPLRQYPDVNPPVVSIETTYRGAAAPIVETRITQLVEDAVSGVEGIKFISSTSQDGQSRVTIEFRLNRDVDDAANDIRDRVSRISDDLPEEADPPEIFKVDADTDVIMFINFGSDTLNPLELTDFAQRRLLDSLSVVDGVARVRVGGERVQSMRIWLDHRKMQSRNITINDIIQALEDENVELPAGRIESVTREFTLRLKRLYRTPEDFSGLVIGRGGNNSLITLGDVARIERGAEDDRSELRGNGQNMISFGIVKQSTANTLAVAQAVKAKVAQLQSILPESTQMYQSYDTSLFIAASIKEVYHTLYIAMIMVIMVIYLFLGTFRAMIIPAITVPISLISAFILLYILDFSLNLLTLLALVLAIGLVVDDSIIMLENIQRRINEGERRLTAAYLGARQIGFAVIATTLVLIAVFVPITFLEGNVGRLFTEFAFAMIAAVSFSSLVALTLSPMLCSKLLDRSRVSTHVSSLANQYFERLMMRYRAMLHRIINAQWVVILLCVVTIAGVYGLASSIREEFVPKEDRGVFFARLNAPEGTSYTESQKFARALEADLLPLLQSGEAIRVLVRVPGSFSSSETVNSAIAIIVLEQWGDRKRSVFDISQDINKKMREYVGVKAFTILPQGLNQGSSSRPVEFVIGGSTYDELAHWRDILVTHAQAYKGLEGIDTDYKETKPQILVKVDQLRAAELGVTVRNIAQTLEVLLASRRVTTYPDRGEEYDVILESDAYGFNSPEDIYQIYVRSDTSGELIPLANLVTFEDIAVSPALNRYNRVRAVTLSANIAENYSLGEVLTELRRLAKKHLPENVQIDYRGQSLEFMESSESNMLIFVLALAMVYLVLAAQFESFLHPLTIMLTVPLALFGGLAGLYLTGLTLNIYSQIGLIMLVGLATKNGILIVEFANQLRDEGAPRCDAVIQASTVRLRPILMTSITTMIGSVPLVLSTGAGAESRLVLGVVIICGVLFSTVLTLFVIPVIYDMIGRYTHTTGEVQRRLNTQLEGLDI